MHVNMSKNSFLAVMRASKLLVILAMIAMMLWSVGTANAQRNADPDSDGLRTAQERNVTQTNPHKTDTDGDHIKDGNEDDDGDDNQDGDEDDQDDDCDGVVDEDDQGEDEQ